MSGLELFYDLHEQIKQAPDFGCVKRAELLVAAFEDDGVTDAAAFVVRSALFGENDEPQKLRPVPYSRSIEWVLHVICVVSDVVYDPILPEPTSIGAYPELMFGAHPVVITPRG